MVSWGKIEFDVKNRTDIVLLARLLRGLGAGLFKLDDSSHDIIAVYDERFLEYLLKDRRIDAKLARDCTNYLRKFGGKRLDYNSYLKISKTIRPYLEEHCEVNHTLHMLMLESGVGHAHVPHLLASWRTSMS